MKAFESWRKHEMRNNSLRVYLDWLALGSRMKFTGEQQVGATLGQIRVDHTARYRWVCERLRELPRFVLDAACGCGYGTAIIADALPETQVIGLDINKVAIDYATRHWKRENNHFNCCDVVGLDCWTDVDAIVSFETLEHIQHYTDFARAALAALRPGGYWYVSVPNEDVIPFTQKRWPFHVKHFTPNELQYLLYDAGFIVEAWYGQKRYGTEVTEGTDRAKHIIAIARKPCE